MSRKRTRWYIESDAEIPDFAYRQYDDSAVRIAQQFAIKDKAFVSVYEVKDGRRAIGVAGILTYGLFWAHVTDQRLRDAIERVENNG